MISKLPYDPGCPGKQTTDWTDNIRHLPRKEPVPLSCSGLIPRIFRVGSRTYPGHPLSIFTLITNDTSTRTSRSVSSHVCREFYLTIELVSIYDLIRRCLPCQRVLRLPGYAVMNKYWETCMTSQNIPDISIFV